MLLDRLRCTLGEEAPDQEAKEEEEGEDGEDNAGRQTADEGRQDGLPEAKGLTTRLEWFIHEDMELGGEGVCSTDVYK